MPNPLNIPGIGKSTLELFEVAGFSNLDSLAKAEVDSLLNELERANQLLSICTDSPSREDVEYSIQYARDATGLGDAIDAPPLISVNFEQSPVVIPLLAVAPFAIPLPGRLLMENQLKVSDIPAAIVLNRYAGDLDVRVEQRVPASRPSKASTASIGNITKPDGSSQRVDIDVSRLRSIDDVATPSSFPVEQNLGTASNNFGLQRNHSVSNTKTQNTDSKWRVRGDLHARPVSIIFSAIVTLMSVIMIPTPIISAILLLLSSEIPQSFGWVPGWLIWIPAFLPLIGFLYLIFSMNVRCRVCGQKLFVHSRHIKNPKAHYFKIFGYVIPLCLQMIVFRWFRCTHCGTPARLKES